MADFLFPTSMQYPEVDGPASRLVHRLSEMDWKAPGIAVTFSEYGLGRRVDRVTGAGWRMSFGRPQGYCHRLRLNNTAALRSIVIGRRAISIYEDHSGPRMAIWVAKDEPPGGFDSFSGMNEKLNNKPRTVLQYLGSDEPGRFVWYCGRIGSRVSPYLLHTNDLDRMYDPEEGEPKVFRTHDVLTEMGLFIESVVRSLSPMTLAGKVARGE